MIYELNGKIKFISLILFTNIFLWKILILFHKEKKKKDLKDVNLNFNLNLITLSHKIMIKREDDKIDENINNN